MNRIKCKRSKPCKNRKSYDGSYNSKLICKRSKIKERTSGSCARNNHIKRKLSGDIVGLSKAMSKRMKSATGYDNDSNPECLYCGDFWLDVKGRWIECESCKKWACGKLSVRKWTKNRNILIVKSMGHLLIFNHIQ